MGAPDEHDGLSPSVLSYSLTSTTRKVTRRLLLSTPLEFAPGLLLLELRELLELSWSVLRMPRMGVFPLCKLD